MYARANLPERLRHWHSPRINRWERLCVTAGTLAIERLDAAGVATERLETDDIRWIAPGVRWRVAHLDPGTQFELEIHAENRPAEGTPQPLREALLSEAGQLTVADEAEFSRLIDTLQTDKRCVARGEFDYRPALHAAVQAAGGTLFWHPLAAGATNFTALIARAARPIGLADYLGHDHAVIEAALAGTLRGDAEYEKWLQATLARHLAIEEELLFPAYLAAGGREAWVRGLKNEHKYLRQYLASLAEPDARRKFLRLLDGHDEKEERVVYPDIVARLNDKADALFKTATTF
ncbi:MAG: hemerythrin domain-containing protein [Gammaproteobacteria bacterium]